MWFSFTTLFCHLYPFSFGHFLCPFFILFAMYQQKVDCNCKKPVNDENVVISLDDLLGENIGYQAVQSFTKDTKRLNQTSCSVLGN